MHSHPDPDFQKAEPPCVDICPVEALQKRPDGIVDFDGRRCIGCKACAQACPYNALYIDSDSHTSAKCNYCAHRKEVGLQSACVTVCPQQAIVSGDLDDPSSKIAALVAVEQTVVRKPEKGTSPKLYYINGDGASLDPLQTPFQEAYHWSAQARGCRPFRGQGQGLFECLGDCHVRQSAHRTRLSTVASPCNTSCSGCFGAAFRVSRIHISEKSLATHPAVS
ncbi:MAG: 4Fe-4S dicluster domain-containing protein [Chlorobi bacterium]|nr:4Fe-4S dicluster domain-containing protein [Chlorobiota bacterium]